MPPAVLVSDHFQSSPWEEFVDLAVIPRQFPQATLPRASDWDFGLPLEGVALPLRFHQTHQYVIWATRPSCVVDAAADCWVETMAMAHAQKED